MNAERIEQLSKGAEVAHVRVWLRREDVTAARVATLFGNLAPSTAITLEFWDLRDPTLRRLEEVGLSADPDRIVGRPLAYSVDRAELGDLLGTLMSESFGLWLGMDDAEVKKAAVKKTNRARALALPPGGRFVILSLYDDNFELFAKGISDLELAAEVDEAIENVPPDATARV